MSFQQFIYQQLGIPMPPEPVFSAEVAETISKLRDAPPLWSLEEDFEIQRVPHKIEDPLGTIDRWVREYYKNLTEEIELGAMGIYVIVQRPAEAKSAVRYTVNVSYFLSSGRIIVTVESFVNDFNRAVGV